MNDVVGHAYSGMPARLYVIDKHGKIAYKSGRGPFGFRVGEMEQALIMTLLDDKPPKKPEADDRQSSRFPQLSNDEALKKLPGAEGRLPAWALALVESSPRTTATMLELDYLHRAKNPLGEVLAAKIRWTVADALDTSYGKRTAEADLRRAGVKDDEIRELTSNRKTSPADASVLAFCRKLTKAGHSLTDEEVAAIVEEFGTEKVMAMAHTVAFANFENRIFLGLGLQVERDGPLPPVEMTFDKDALAKIAAAERLPLDKAERSEVPRIDVKPEWHGYGEVEKALEAQKNRKPRIQPADEERLAQLSPEARKRAENSKILWTKLSVGYQPALTLSWLSCLATWHDEAKLDAVFANSMFWVVTRSNECFY
jgi:alkylhydroperoxidase family enzyme